MPIENLASSARNEQDAARSASIQAHRRRFARSWLARMRSGSLIELKPGNARKLFLVHDGEGETLVYLPLARHLPNELAVFAIEPRSIPGVPLAHSTIEDMAAFCLEAVRKKQPQGPYLLGGLCAGGIIAYEMAAQLHLAGESVELVVLLESALPNALERPGRLAEQRQNRLRQAVTQVQEGAPNTALRLAGVARVIARKLFGVILWEISQPFVRLWIHIRFRLLRSVLKRNLRWPKIIPELNVRQIFEAVQARYKPRPLPLSSVLLVRARSGVGDDTPYREVFADGTFGWNILAHGIRSVDVDGGHSTMLQEPFVNSLASALAPYLQSGTTR